MPYAVEFFRDGQPVRVALPTRGAVLPVRSRGGFVGMLPWGGPDAECVADEEPGHFYRWPEGGHVPLEVVKHGDWWQLKPEPVRIAVAAFHVCHTKAGEVLDTWVRLKPGEYLQGALARKFADQRVYIVTVDPPAEWADITTPWPRIVRTPSPP